MLYAFPILIAAMLAYMYWHAGYRMRRDRILLQKSLKEASPPAAQDLNSGAEERPLR